MNRVNPDGRIVVPATIILVLIAATAVLGQMRMIPANVAGGFIIGLVIGMLGCLAFYSFKDIL